MRWMRHILLYEMTREEFRERVQELEAVIIPTGSIEQHGAHLPLIHDTISALHIATMAAEKMYPRIMVSIPVSVGISEHWMGFPGTLTIRPEVFSKLLFDLCHSLQRQGVKKIIILNGHAGNWQTIMKTLGKVRKGLHVDIKALCYWHLIPLEIADKVLETKVFPGHACEFETSIALAAFPEKVRKDVALSGGAALATRRKGEVMVATAVEGLVSLLKKDVAKLDK